MLQRLCTAVSLAVLPVAPLVLMQNNGVSDFSQDYLAARAMIAGQDPSAPTATLAALHGVPPDAVTAQQNAHPPASILVAMPFALLEWPFARLAFFAVSWVVVAWIYLRGALPPGVQLAMLAPMIMELHFGALEPFLFELIAVAIRRQNESASVMALALGSAIMLKIYPVVVLYVLWCNGRREALIRTIAVASGIGLLTLGAFGFEVWRDWLLFSGVNARNFIALSINLSLTGAVHTLTSLSPTLISIGLVICLGIPVGFVAKGIEPMLPVMLLASPITWPHYVPVGLLGTMPRALLVATSLAAATIVASVYGFIPVDAQPTISLAVTLSLMLVWLHSLWAGYWAARRERLTGPQPDTQALSAQDSLTAWNREREKGAAAGSQLEPEL